MDRNDSRKEIHYRYVCRLASEFSPNNSDYASTVSNAIFAMRDMTEMICTESNSEEVEVEGLRYFEPETFLVDTRNLIDMIEYFLLDGNPIKKSNSF